MCTKNVLSAKYIVSALDGAFSTEHDRACAQLESVVILSQRGVAHSITTCRCGATGRGITAILYKLNIAV